MDWKYKCKRLLGNRYAMTAVLFLCIMAWGSFTVLFGALDLKTGCDGYAVPADRAAAVKADPALPRREAEVPAADLSAPAPVKSWPRQLAGKTAGAEALVTKALEEEHSLIQLYGAFQEFSDRTVVEDPADAQYAVVRLPDGSLTFVGQGVADPQVQAAELGRLQQALARREAALLYLQAPSKLEPENTTLPYGLEDPSNACADALLARLEEQGVDYLDLRQVLREAGGSWTDWFYRTDHHWTAEAAFLSFQAVAGQLERYDQTLPAGAGTKRQTIVLDPRCADREQYAVTTLPGYFLGSQGKRVGSLYAGSDDFALWQPKYPTLFHYEAPGYNVDRYGDLTETVLFDQRVEEKDYFGNNPYTYYAGGDYAFARITNYYNPQGPRIMLIRDSYACAITPYLALCSSSLSTVDPRSYRGDLLGLIDREKPDVVMVLYSSGMVRSEEHYRLLKQPAGPSKGDVLRWKDDWYGPES